MADQTPSTPSTPSVDASCWDVVAAGGRNRNHLALRLACFELGLTALVVEPGMRTEIHGRRARVTHADTPRADVVAAMREARCVAVALRDPQDPTGLEEVADAIALGKPLVATASSAFPDDLADRGAGVLVEDDSAQAWVEALREVLADPGAWSAARMGEWRAPAGPAAAGRRTGGARRPRRGALAAAGVAAAIIPPLLGGR